MTLYGKVSVPVGSEKGDEEERSKKKGIGSSASSAGVGKLQMLQDSNLKSLLANTYVCRAGSVLYKFTQSAQK